MALFASHDFTLLFFLFSKILNLLYSTIQQDLQFSIIITIMTKYSIIYVKESNFQIETVSAMCLKEKSTDTKVCHERPCVIFHVRSH